MRIPAFAAALAAATGSVCAQESADTIAARQLIFGREHVDPTGALPDDKVIFSWLSTSAFGAAVEGRVIMLDSYATRLEVEPGRTPFVIADLVALNPEAILIGHGHGDHADNAVDNLLAGRHARFRTHPLAEALFLPSVRREEVAHREAVERIIDFVEPERYRHVPVGAFPSASRS